MVDLPLSKCSVLFLLSFIIHPMSLPTHIYHHFMYLCRNKWLIDQLLHDSMAIDHIGEDHISQGQCSYLKLMIYCWSSNWSNTIAFEIDIIWVLHVLDRTCWLYKRHQSRNYRRPHQPSLMPFRSISKNA